MKDRYLKGFRLISSLLLALVAGACANEMAPTGGKTDTDPPKVVFSNPAHESTRVKTRQVVIQFNEYIQAGAFQKTIVSPAMQKPPIFKVKGKTLSIIFQDSLRDQVTYRLFFDEDIKDNNEGNVLQDYALAFSTGPEIDTAKASGQVLDARSNIGVERVWVGLYTRELDVLEAKPLYVCRTGAQGAFTFANVKPGTYYIRAFKDEDQSITYNQPNEEIGFLSEPIKVTNDSMVKANLFLFKEQLPVNRIKSVKCEASGNLLLATASPFRMDQIKFSKRFNFQYWMNEESDSAVIFPETSDSTRFKVFLEQKDGLDSARIDCKKTSYNKRFGNNVYPLTAKYQQVTKENEVKWPIFSLQKAALDSFRIEFPVPISEIPNPQAIKILKDSLIEVPVLALEVDALDRRILNTKMLLEPGAKYFVVFPDSSILFYNRSVNGSFLLQLSNGKLSDYGSLDILLEKNTQYTGDYLLRIFREDGGLHQKYRVGNEGGRISEKSIPAGNYRFEVVMDANRNGKWDTGNFRENRLPEKVFLPVKTQTVKAGWQQEVILKPQ